MIQTSSAVDNFYITEDVKNTPSRSKNVDEETEFLQRVYGALLIRSSCLLLKSPVSVVITAQTLLHRFYTKKSLTEYDVKLVATACIVLACKLEEKDRKLRDVLNSVRRAVQRIEKKPRVVLPINTPEYEISKTDAKNMEMVLLREFGFFAHVSPPHPFAYTLGVHLNLSDESMKRTWTLCNDSAMTALCVRFKPQIVACGCILLAARELGIALPSRPPWYRLVDGATKENLEVIAQTILALHQLDTVEYKDLSGQDLPLEGHVKKSERNDGSHRRRRESRSPQGSRRVRRRDSRDFDEGRRR
jgi:transcription initiation factor TFIIIB Brf1 subunit/transcription initiation factor TFIIB